MEQRLLRNSCIWAVPKSSYVTGLMGHCPGRHVTPLHPWSSGLDSCAVFSFINSELNRNQFDLRINESENQNKAFEPSWANIMLRFRNTWDQNEIILVYTTVVVKSLCSKLIIKLNDRYSGAERLVPVLAVSTETWQAAYLKRVDVYVGWGGIRVNVQEHGGPAATLLMHVGAEEKKKKRDS